MPSRSSVVPRLEMGEILADLRRVSGMDMAAAGFVSERGDSFALTQFSGTLGRSLRNLTVQANQGLGGRALATGRAAMVSSYTRARGITHLYDAAVSAEGVQTAAALPVVVGRRTRAMLYVGHRAALDVGDRWLDSMTPVVQRLEREIEVQDEVARRVAAAASDQQRRRSSEIADVAAELAALTASVSDEALRQRLDVARRKLASWAGAALPPILPRIELSRREIDVITEVARGRTTTEVAGVLGILPNTAKSYLKTAMRKLGATNRVQAIVAARSMGYLD